MRYGYNVCQSNVWKVYKSLVIRITLHEFLRMSELLFRDLLYFRYNGLLANIVGDSNEFSLKVNEVVPPQ